jgi:hypothetical protein
MDIIFKCSFCKQDLEVDAGAAGQKITCPSCNHSLVIPQADPSNLRTGLASLSSAAAKEEKHFAVPVSENPTQPLIHKPLPTLEVAAKDGNRQLRIKTLRHSDCKEVGHDNFDKVATEILGKIGEENIVSLNTISYTYIDIGTQKLITDFGLLIVYKS